MSQLGLGKLWYVSVASVGLALFFLATLVYTRLTVVDPYSSIAGRWRGLADAIAFVHCACLLAYSALALRGMVARDRVVAGIVGLMGAIVVAAAANASGTEAADVFRLSVGARAWWISGLLALAAFPAARAGWTTTNTAAWNGWWIFGGVCLGLGLLLYLSRSNASPFAMLGKIVLVLIIPAICFIATFLWYRGRYALILRGLGVIGTVVTVAVATIR